MYFTARDSVTRSETAPRLMGWQRILFGFMYRNAVHAADRFDLPAEKFLEIRHRIESGTTTA